MFFFYILRCSDDTFYVGHTVNLESRIASHNDGLGSSYTARRLPVALVHYETLPDPPCGADARAPAETLERRQEGRADRRRPEDAQIPQ